MKKISYSVIQLFRYFFRMKTKIFFLSITFCFVVLNISAQYEFLKMPMVEGEIQFFPTFNSCSYYYRPSGDASFRIEYKRANETTWHAAHVTVCDQPEKIQKGSLFNLDEDTDYQVCIFNGSDSKAALQANFRTWSSAPRIARTIDLSTLPGVAKDGIVITEQGAPDAWIKYTAPAGWVVNRTYRDADTQKAAIVLNGAKYIILENLTVEGGKQHGILVDNCDFVRILNCELSGWGRLGEQQFVNGEYCGQYKDAEGKFIDYDGGIQIRGSFATVVERCYIHDPRGRSNSWVFSHPSGPQAIVVDQTRGGNVVRWNDFVGSDEHRWNDVIECLENGSPHGGMFRDSDITGNYLAFGNDDGIELEGGGMNLRFIGNKVEGCLAGFSLAPTLIGPQYAIGNLIVNLGDEEGLTLMFIKNNFGGRTMQYGKRFIYNNTFHAFDRTVGVYTFYGNAPTDAGLGTMRNNIFVCNESRMSGDWVKAENFDHDLYWVRLSHTDTERYIAAMHNYGQEKNAITADPLHIDPATGDYRLAPSSPARGKAVEVKGITNAGDDFGAFFNGVTDLPLRPLSLATSPAQVNFESTGGTSTVTLSLPADATGPVTFQIRQNKVFDWFTVTPANGTVSPGQTLKLTVTTDAARITGRPNFRGAFLVRTPNGLSRPVTVYAKGNYTEDKRPASAPNTVYIQPESGASDTHINIPKDGIYAVLARVTRTPRNTSNPPQQGGRGQRFNIQINGENSPITASTGDWYLRNEDERVLFLSSLGTLKAGDNHLDIKFNNPSLAVVEYIVTDNPVVFFLQGRYMR